ncbi:MAG: RluA family pseudouridine synthase [Tissierellia bacterium]|nr:RluA family pseudouridine synthase [Tissierellia bacterium]
MDLLKNSEKVIVIKVDAEGKTLKEYLFDQDISTRLFRKLFKQKNIYVNGKNVRMEHVLKNGDLISILIEDEKENSTPEPMDLHIIYEDYDILVLNKQPYVVVHPTKSHQQNTISNGLSYYFKSNGINRKIRFVNRLDMNTSGILIVAKSAFAHQQMALQFERNQVEKKYIAVVDGVVRKDEDIIELPVGREEEGSIKKVVTEDGKNAITKYRVLERYEAATLLDVQIFTGKSHQIRVHLNHIGHPIIGDSLYNRTSDIIGRQALHSYYMKIKLPRDKREMEFKAPIPEDIQNLIDSLKVSKL